MAVEDKRAAARAILEQIDMPRGQRNDRSARTLLALGDLTPARSWARTANPIMGITSIIEWIAAHCGKRYAPNTRETIRRQSVHRFMEAGLVVYNGDAPDRAVNSPKAGYQLSPAAVTLLRAQASAGWTAALSTYLAAKPSLAAQYASERQASMIPVNIPGNRTIALSPGTHSELIRNIVEKFLPIHTPGAHLLYIGDTGDKAGYFDEPALAALGVTIDRHGKMSDVVLHDVRRGWMVLVESVTSHGPVDAKRHGELRRLFASSTAGLVFVTAFPARAGLAHHLDSLAWETEVWVSASPTHLIHLDGERFLGPYG